MGFFDEQLWLQSHRHSSMHNKGKRHNANHVFTLITLSAGSEAKQSHFQMFVRREASDSSF